MVTISGSTAIGQKASKQILSAFRNDLQIYQGPAEADGCPTYNIFDPVSNHYYKISWFEYEVIRKIYSGMALEDLVSEVNRNAALEVDEKNILAFLQQAQECHLLSAPLPSKAILMQAQRKKMSLLTMALHYYLYIRIPLVKPDRFLAYTLPFARLFATPAALASYIFCFCWGLLLSVGRMDEFVHTFTYFFNFKGALAYSTAIILVKVLHELGHAYVAKHYDLRVSRMGVVFIVLWPVMYSDVTDAWKLYERKKRLWISAAGVSVELVISALSLLGWALTNDGIAHSIFFVICSAIIVSTLLVNLNPAMRFDGYYLMSDLLCIDNLQMRANALAVWGWRKVFLGLDFPCPEDHLPPPRLRLMMAVAIYSWIYRFFLYLSIAVFIYFKFAKAFGIFLFFVEIGVFILLPFYREARQLYQIKMFFKWNKRLITTLSIAALAFLWAAFPFSHALTLPAIIVPTVEQTIYAPASGQIKEIAVKRFDLVQQGQTLAQIFSMNLEQQIQKSQVEKQILEQQIFILENAKNKQTQSDYSYLPQKKAELKGVKAQLQSLLEAKQQNFLQAKITGTVYEWDDSLSEEQYVKKSQALGKIAAMQQMQIYAFVPEDEMGLIAEGDVAYFIPNGTSEHWQTHINSINTVRVEKLPYPQLASTNQGPLPVTLSAGHELLMVSSYFMIKVILDDSSYHFEIGKTGEVIIPSKRYSLLWKLWKFTQALFWREATL